MIMTMMFSGPETVFMHFMFCDPKIKEHNLVLNKPNYWHDVLQT